MPRAPGTSTALTGVTGQEAQTIRAFTLESGKRVEAFTTRPGKDRVDSANPLCAIWREHTKSSDDVKITIWSEPTAQRMQIGGGRHAFVEAAAECETVAELRQVWKSSSIWGNYSELLRTWPTPVRLLVAEARLPGTRGDEPCAWTRWL